MYLLLELYLDLIKLVCYSPFPHSSRKNELND